MDKNGQNRGRPTKYKPEYCQKIIDYFTNADLYEEVELPHYNEDGSIKWKDKKRFAAKLPTLVQFAKKIGVDYRTVYRWQDEQELAKNEDYQQNFRQAYARAKALQRDFLIQAGLTGVYNARFAEFTAINITDMKKKVETEVYPSDSMVELLEKVRENGQIGPSGRKAVTGTLVGPILEVKQPLLCSERAE